MEAYTDVYTNLQVAKLNDGRLPTMDSSHLIAKKDEVVHFETSAALLKEVALKESFEVARRASVSASPRACVTASGRCGGTW